MDQKQAFTIVKEFLDYLRENKYNIQKAYIFGSYAKGKFHEDSDIDLAIVLQNLSNSFTMQIELMKLSRKFDSRIEPHPLDADTFNDSHPFAREILSYGIEVV